MSGDVVIETEVHQKVAVMTDEDDEFVPSVDEMLKEKGIDDPFTMHILYTLGIVTASDLNKKSIEDLIEV